MSSGERIYYAICRILQNIINRSVCIDKFQKIQNHKCTRASVKCN